MFGGPRNSAGNEAGNCVDYSMWLWNIPMARVRGTWRGRPLGSRERGLP